jgi:Protein of unknown function (DUF3096)
VKFTHRIGWLILLIAISCSTVSALVEPRSIGGFTIRYASISPIMALLAGILILIMPRLLNYIVALYLILVGLIGLVGV